MKKRNIIFSMLLSCLVLAACDSSNEYETDRQSSSIENNQETSSSVIFEETYQTNSMYDNQEKQVSSITEKQEQTLISYTQLDCEDRGYTLKYRGKDTWNVALNYINNKNRWIVTCNDVNYGRIKAIYEWDGEENSGATLIYLLVSGNELVNNLNT